MANYTILLVDDDKETVDLYAESLEAAGYDVLRCAGERPAKALIHNKPASFDLAIIDVRLRPPRDDTSGFEVAKAIKRDIPVVIFSENLNLERALRAGSLSKEGAIRDAHVIRKSDGPEALIDLIRKILPHRVFIAHGHDTNFRHDVFLTLTNLGVSPTVLMETATEGDTIAESIERHSNVSFAVILVTADDLGKAKNDKALQPRARQNVMVEWGYFIGKLGRQRVIALNKSDPKKPIELLPTDYYGLRFIPVDNDGKWRRSLAKELANAGIPVHLERLPP
ncbi:MAG TPA: TIR domain-containing protein [Thermoanaerobaculia bacterium]|jgi:CheY-like chemotaxis protein|nr:TIR domain-containing protein [Thermoanaerobaculia bacterium]